MKAYTVMGPRDLRCLEVPTPALRPHDVLIRVRRAGICATDMGIYTGQSSFVESGQITYPCRFGHEFSGEVVKVGEKVTAYRVGDRVFADSGVACGECEACRAGRYQKCQNMRSLGTVNCWDGCFAEYILIPDYHTHRIPDGVTYDEAALIEPTSISLDTFCGYTFTGKDTVAVIGTGAIGMSAAWLARYFGAGQVILIGRAESKLEVAHRIGADRTVNSRETDPVAAVKALTGGRGADLVVEGAGTPETFMQSLGMVASGGRVSLVSFYEQLLDGVPVDQLALRRVTLAGAAGVLGNPERVAEVMAKNPIRLTPVITHHVKFSEMSDPFEHAEKYRREKIKIMVDFDN